jgi:hypothetical protein
MTRGALIFAFNNQHTDYLAMAAWAARRVQQWLDIPVAVVTNVTDSDSLSAFDCVINAPAQSGGGRWFSDYGTHVEWYNAGRPEAYDLTPWDHTLVLDSDYVVNSGQLNTLFDADNDFLCYRDCVDITSPDQPLLKTFGKFNLPMWWATVMCFNKSNTSQYIFESMKMVRNNWQHYRDLFGISETTYRNDYALSIALGIVSGHTWKVNNIPWPMMATLPDHRLDLQTVGTVDMWTINYQNNQSRPTKMALAGMDFHAMGKQSLGEIIERS